MSGETPATFSHRTMTEEQWRTYLKVTLGRRRPRALMLNGGYYHVEYLSAPQGLIVLAHREADGGQVDGIHPASLSRYVDSDRNIIEPLLGSDNGYAVHYLTRRQHGGLVLGAYGRMIHAGAPEAPGFSRDSGSFKLVIFNEANGPIVCVIEEQDIIHVIERDVVASLKGKAA